MNPETIVKSFIEDYYRWNEKMFARSEQIRTSHEAALSAIGAQYPPKIDQITDIPRYLQIEMQNSAEHTELMRNADEEYENIIKRYCRPNHQRLSISFGSDSSHHPENEEIVSVEITGDQALVKTRRTEKLDFMDFVSDYEFYLTNENERWYLKQIYYIDEEGKYEAL